MKKKVLEAIIELLKDPKEKWSFDGYTAMHCESRIAIWTENFPVFNTNTYPVPMNIGLVGKWRLWRAVQVARDNSFMRTIEKAKNKKP